MRSFLQQHGLRTGFPRKVGLYTSPDLTSIRERIQIDDRPIAKELFAKYFFEVWDKLLPENTDSKDSTQLQKLPRFLQMLELVAFHTFIREGTEAAVIETHHGGEYDATNIIQKPKVTAITSIGLDHVDQLGPTIENIAWHKSGIFKPGAKAFAAPQEPQVEAVLQDRAREKGVEVQFVPINSSLPENALALQAPVQKTNCSLALAIASAFLEQTAPRNDNKLTAEDISSGIDNFSWPGRFEILVDGNLQWFLDGAHNELSIGQAAEWFVKSSRLKSQYVMLIVPDRRLLLNNCRSVLSSARQFPQILIFTHISDNRDGPALCERLARTLTACNSLPDHVILTTYQERINGSTRIGTKLTKISLGSYADPR